ncbi:MAG: LysR family transcriptional regulator [Deltaproteobacteria bacterium]|nr:LysR family transcriptional regulator [Deltaproteobacteria bacterium]
MNLNQLKIFYLAVKHGNLSAAGKTLNITQPAVTKGIQRLQDHYDVQLLNRLGKKLVLTDAGEALFQIAEKIFELDRLAEDCVRDFQRNERGHIRIDASESFGAYYLPSNVNPFSLANPGLRISVNILPTEQVADNTANLKNDLGFISFSIVNEKLRICEILADRFVVIAPVDHPFAKKRILEPADLEGQSMVVHEIGSVPHQAVERLVREHRISVSIPLELSSNRAIKRAVENGAGIALVSRKVAHEEVRMGTLVAIPISDKSFTRKFYMVHHRNKYLSKNLQAFIRDVHRWADAYQGRAGGVESQ